MKRIIMSAAAIVALAIPAAASANVNPVNHRLAACFVGQDMGIVRANAPTQRVALCALVREMDSVVNANPYTAIAMKINKQWFLVGATQFNGYREYTFNEAGQNADQLEVTLATAIPAPSGGGTGELPRAGSWS